jgi:hypothetical protein
VFGQPHSCTIWQRRFTRVNYGAPRNVSFQGVHGRPWPQVSGSVKDQDRDAERVAGVDQLRLVPGPSSAPWITPQRIKE